MMMELLRHQEPVILKGPKYVSIILKNFLFFESTFEHTEMEMHHINKFLMNGRLIIWIRTSIKTSTDVIIFP